MGRFISFEGCEGSGKSTQLRLLKEYLTEKNPTERNKNAIFAREPGGTVVSERIREVILDGRLSDMTDECEALLYAAARAQLLSEVILPALESDKTVILDRYIDSSLAYQGYARGLGFDFVERVNSFAMAHQPNLTIFLDIKSSDAFKRKGGKDENDRIENAGEAFHNKVYEGYKELSLRFPERFLCFDVSGTKFETNEKIIKLLIERGYID